MNKKNIINTYVKYNNRLYKAIGFNSITAMARFCEKNKEYVLLGTDPVFNIHYVGLSIPVFWTVSSYVELEPNR
jgi:hypothetical protein